MNISRRTYAAIAAPLLGSALLLAGCSSDNDSKDKGITDYDTTSQTASAGASSCPTTPAASDVKPQYIFHGTTGSAAVTGSTDTAGPLVKITAPYNASRTEVHTLTEGTGPVVGEHSNVTVCYQGVNGRDGKIFDQTPYQEGQGATFGLDGVVPGFAKAIAGQRVGSTVAVAMIPADGYGASGQPAAGIEPGDTLVFAIKILNNQ